MSKERLEDIEQTINIYCKHKALPVTLNQEDAKWIVKYAKEQAGRAQELERVNKQLKNNLSVYKGYYKNMIKINEDTVEENKKYRRLIKNMGQEIEVLTDVVSNADNADELNEEVIRLKGVLKNEMS